MPALKWRNLPQHGQVPLPWLEKDLELDLQASAQGRVHTSPCSKSRWDFFIPEWGIRYSLRKNDLEEVWCQEESCSHSRGKIHSQAFGTIAKWSGGWPCLSQYRYQASRGPEGLVTKHRLDLLTKQKMQENRGWVKRQRIGTHLRQKPNDMPTVLWGCTPHYIPTLRSEGISDRSSLENKLKKDLIWV